MTSRETKWKSEAIYVDQETGEVLKRNSVQSGRYVLIKTTKYYKKNGNINETTYVKECKKSRQTRIFTDD
jgi:hypothetical protein